LKNNLKTFCIWLTGISGAGKSTLGNRLNNLLILNNYSSVILDGDLIREKINKDLSYSMKDRDENIRRIACISDLLSQQNFITIVSVISPMKSQRTFAKNVYGENFNEVFLKASIERCIKNDAKGLYKKAMHQKTSNFTALTSPYEEPENPDLVIDTNLNNVEKSMEILITFLQNKYKINFKK
jgi:adenylyl-sulfate kinase